MNRAKKKKLLVSGVVGLLIFVFLMLPAMGLAGLVWSEHVVRSKRLPEAKVPEVKGLDKDQAEAKLRASGLKIRVLAERWDLDAPVDVVVDQNPITGESVEVGHTVGVVLSAKEP
jgi:beta-lactam-binding protein with PASTA domain